MVDKIYFNLQSLQKEGKVKRETKAGGAFQFRFGQAPPLLSKKEEVALAKRKERGDQRVRDQFIEANIRLAIDMAGRPQYRNRGLPREDLIQEAIIGLMKAVDKLDWRRGYRFSTYACWWIRHYLNRAIEKYGSTVHIASHVLVRQKIFKRARASYGRRYGREPTEEELAAILQWSKKQVEERQGLALSSRAAIPIVNQPTGEIITGEQTGVISEGNLSDQTCIDPVHSIFLQELRQHLAVILSELKPVEKDIVTLRLQYEAKLNEIAKRHGLSRERVRQIQVQLVEKIRQRLGAWLELDQLSAN